MLEILLLGPLAIAELGVSTGLLLNRCGEGSRLKREAAEQGTQVDRSRQHTVVQQRDMRSTFAGGW